MVNGCVAVRGAPFDYDRWESVRQPGLGLGRAPAVLHRIEDDSTSASTPYHGDRGPIQSGATGERVEAGQPRVREACVELGLSQAARPERAATRTRAWSGRGRRTASTRCGSARSSRTSGARAAGPDFTLRADCLVDRVLLDGTAGRRASATSTRRSPRSTSAPASWSSRPASTRRRRSCSARASGPPATCCRLGIEPVGGPPRRAEPARPPQLRLPVHAPELAERRAACSSRTAGGR